MHTSVLRPAPSHPPGLQESGTSNMLQDKDPCTCLPIKSVWLPTDKELYPCIQQNALIEQSSPSLTTKRQARWCSPLIRGTHYHICQFNGNHFKLLVSDKGIKFYLVISIETKEFAEIFGIWFLNHIFLSVTFTKQHWFSKTGKRKWEEPDGNKWVTITPRLY